MKTESAATSFQPLSSIPRDKKTLDFILKKLTENSSPDRYQVLQELLEMHRTSVGFDPFALTKGRFKRFRSSEIRKVLVDLEQELSVITSSEEYLQYLEDSTRHQGLIEQYLNMVSLITAPPTKELNDQVDLFIAQLERENANELLLLFYKQAEKHFLGRTKDLEKVIDCYSSLLAKMEIRNNFLKCGLQSALLLQQALRSNTKQENLLLHFKNLTTILKEVTGKAERKDLLRQIINIGLCIDHRVKHITPYIKLINNEIVEITAGNTKQDIELLATATIYNVSADIQVRKKILDRLAETGKTIEDKQFLVYIKYGLAIIESEVGNYEGALLLLNEAEHLLYRNGFKNSSKKDWIEICILRFYLYVLSDKISNALFEDSAYDGVIQMLRDALSDHSSLNATINGLKGLKEFTRGDAQQAEYFISISLEEEKNLPLKYNHIIFRGILQSLKNNDKSLNKTVDELIALKEPFYSRVLSNLLDKA